MRMSSSALCLVLCCLGLTTAFMMPSRSPEERTADLAQQLYEELRDSRNELEEKQAPPTDTMAELEHYLKMRQTPPPHSRRSGRILRQSPPPRSRRAYMDAIQSLETRQSPPPRSKDVYREMRQSKSDALNRIKSRVRSQGKRNLDTPYEDADYKRIDDLSQDIGRR